MEQPGLLKYYGMIPKARGFLILIPCFLFNESAMAAPVQIDPVNLHDSMIISPFMEVLSEGATPRTLRDIQALPDSRWKRLKQNRVFVGINESPKWFRFRFKPRPAYKPKTADAILSLQGPQMDYIELYRPDGKNGYIQKRTGDMFPFRTREIKDRNFSFHIPLSLNSEKYYYIRLNNEVSYIGGIPTLFTGAAYYSFILKDTAALGVFFGFLLIMSLYNLFLFFSIRERVFLHYSCFIFSNLATVLAIEGIGFQFFYPDLPWLQNQGLVLFFPVTGLFALLFSSHYLNFPDLFPTLFKLTQFLMFIHIILGPLLLLFATYASAQYATIFSVLLLTTGPLIFLSAGAYLAWRGDRSARIYLIAWSVLILSTVVRALAGINIFPRNFFTIRAVQIGGALEVTLLSLGLADRINQLKNLLADTNLELEAKVEERTHSLNQSLSRLRELKKRQDGDYFLTSQLTRLLGGNHVNSPFVRADFLIRQNKQFSFQGTRGEIGGDICIADNIKIGDEICTVFLNGDAMGKSIQGAGGALVLGSVFEAIIGRTREAGTPANQLTPEEWLKKTHFELQRVFETFNGGMLISLVAGLIDEQSGVLYLLNAEHPRTVLYRNSRARFLEDESGAARLGVLLPRKQLEILKFKLEKGDIIIMGSDGRDTLLGDPGENSRAKKRIVYNEDAFLLSVERANGNLHKIYRYTRKSGKLIDDISLIRLSYLESKD